MSPARAGHGAGAPPLVIAFEGVLAYCRAGFESDVAAELSDHAARLGCAVAARARPGTAFVELEAFSAEDADHLWRTLRWDALTFARQWLRMFALARGLPASERAGPLAAAASERLAAYSELFLEHPDTNEGKAVSRFCRAFRRPLERALQNAGVARDDSAPRLHAHFVDSGTARLALSEPRNSAPWPLGIPRLKADRDAPSRSALKLEEAFRTFLPAGREADYLHAGMSAVDLGAAPGGWSWELARRGLRVTAVDRARLAPALARDAPVTHVTADGFRYRPPRPVDWLVCDMVEQPHRIAGLVAGWLRRGDCRAAVCNLKLPMKRRWHAVSDALATLGRACPDARVCCKQLYHDREEVTAAVLRA